MKKILSTLFVFVSIQSGTYAAQPNAGRGVPIKLRRFEESPQKRSPAPQSTDQDAPQPEAVPAAQDAPLPFGRMHSIRPESPRS